LSFRHQTVPGLRYRVHGGTNGHGIVFRLSLLNVSPPQLTITLAGANAILTWPANPAGFTLQASTNLVSPGAWITDSPAPVTVNGQNIVTNPVSGTQKFFRLIQLWIGAEDHRPLADH
jgi:hypothetical protein